MRGDAPVIVCWRLSTRRAIVLLSHAQLFAAVAQCDENRNNAPRRTAPGDFLVWRGTRFVPLRAVVSAACGGGGGGDGGGEEPVLGEVTCNTTDAEQRLLELLRRYNSPAFSWAFCAHGHWLCVEPNARRRRRRVTLYSRLELASFYLLARKYGWHVRTLLCAAAAAEFVVQVCEPFRHRRRRRRRRRDNSAAAAAAKTVSSHGYVYKLCT